MYSSSFFTQIKPLDRALPKHTPEPIGSSPLKRGVHQTETHEKTNDILKIKYLNTYGLSFFLSEFKPITFLLSDLKTHPWPIGRPLSRGETHATYFRA